MHNELSYLKKYSLFPLILMTTAQLKGVLIVPHIQGGLLLAWTGEVSAYTACCASCTWLCLVCCLRFTICDKGNFAQSQHWRLRVLIPAQQWIYGKFPRVGKIISFWSEQADFSPVCVLRWAHSAADGSFVGGTSPAHCLIAFVQCTEYAFMAPWLAWQAAAASPMFTLTVDHRI